MAKARLNENKIRKGEISLELEVVEDSVVAGIVPREVVVDGLGSEIGSAGGSTRLDAQQGCLSQRRDWVLLQLGHEPRLEERPALPDRAHTDYRQSAFEGQQLLMSSP